MPETNKQLLYLIIYETVSEIPYGRVATYGQIAKIIGLPRHARHVGFALKSLNKGNQIPWHRVINTKGEIYDIKPNGQSIQKERLENEGIVLTKNYRVNLKKYQWKR